MRKLVLLATVLIVSAGCSSTDDTTPSGSFKKFWAFVRSGESVSAHDMLTAELQEEHSVEALAQKIELINVHWGNVVDDMIEADLSLSVKDGGTWIESPILTLDFRTGVLLQCVNLLVVPEGELLKIGNISCLFQPGWSQSAPDEDNVQYQKL